MTYVLGLLAVVALLVGCAVAVLLAIAGLVEILPPLRARDGDEENADRTPRAHPPSATFNAAVSGLVRQRE